MITTHLLKRGTAVLGALLAFSAAAQAADPSTFPAPTGDTRFVPGGARLELIFDGGCALTEGVAAGHDGMIYFSDITFTKFCKDPSGKYLQAGNIWKYNPKNGEAMEYRAMCYEALEQYEKAIVDYKSLVDLQADNAKTMCAIASDYKNRFQFTNGRYWVQRALNIRPGFGLAYITMAEIYEAAVVYCQDQEKRGRKYDDALVYELAYDEYKKAANDPEYKSTATKRMNSLQMVLPTQEELFMNQNRKTLKLECYSWINQ